MKACLVQCSSVNDIDYNIKKAEHEIKKAYKKGCDLIVFPELFLTGYDTTDYIKNNAMTLKANQLNEIKSLCLKYNIACVIGFPRKEKNKIFNSLAWINNNGVIIDIYDKTHLFGNEKQVFAAGNQLKVIKTEFGNVGLAICYDIEFPEVARTLAQKQADSIVCISANMKPYDELHKQCIISRAIENSIPVIYCNYVGNDKKFTYVGRSNIIGHNGTNVVKFNKSKKSLYCNIDLFNKVTDKNMIYATNLRKDLYL